MLTGPHVAFNSCHDDDSFVSTGSLSSLCDVPFMSYNSVHSSKRRE